MVSGREQALFEAGIKLGALYHQFVGMPLPPDGIEQIEDTIASSVASQPFVREITIQIDRGIIQERLNRFGYCELSGDMLRVTLIVEVRGAVVKAALGMDESGYPLMHIVEEENNL